VRLRTHLPSLLVVTLVWAAPLAAQGVVVSTRTTYDIARIGGGDLRQTTSILGSDREKTVTEGKVKFLVFNRDAGGTQIVRLDQDKAYSRSGKATKYEVVDLPTIRAQMEESRKRAAAAAPESQPNDSIRVYVVNEGMKATGQRKTINGFQTEEQLLHATVMGENTHTGEKAPLFYMTADVWSDASHEKAAKAEQAFAMEYAKHLGVEPGMAMQGNPYARWLESVTTEARKIQGYPIVMQLTVEADQAKDEGTGQSDEAASEAAAKVGKAMGGLMKRIRRKPAAEEKPAGAVDAPKATPGRAILFQMTQEVTSISEQAPPASEFEVPAG
jgi:hypothetical protein